MMVSAVDCNEVDSPRQLLTPLRILKALSAQETAGCPWELPWDNTCPKGSSSQRTQRKPQII